MRKDSRPAINFDTGEVHHKKLFGLTAGWLVGIVVLLGLISAGAWAISVATSDTRGRGDQIKDINKADNRTFAQEQFHELLADIRTYDRQIGTTKASLDAHPAQDAERERLAAVYLGITNQCLSVTQQYDAEVRKISREKFRDADLPEQVDITDSAYDCAPPR